MRVGNDEKRTAEAEGRENQDWCGPENYCPSKMSAFVLWDLSVFETALQSLHASQRSKTLASCSRGINP